MSDRIRRQVATALAIASCLIVGASPASGQVASPQSVAILARGAAWLAGAVGEYLLGKAIDEATGQTVEAAMIAERQQISAQLSAARGAQRQALVAQAAQYDRQLAQMRLMLSTQPSRAEIESLRQDLLSDMQSLASELSELSERVGRIEFTADTIRLLLRRLESISQSAQAPVAAAAQYSSRHSLIVRLGFSPSADASVASQWASLSQRYSRSAPLLAASAGLRLNKLVSFNAMADQWARVDRTASTAEGSTVILSSPFSHWTRSGYLALELHSARRWLAAFAGGGWAWHSTESGTFMSTGEVVNRSRHQGSGFSPVYGGAVSVPLTSNLRLRVELRRSHQAFRLSRVGGPLFDEDVDSQRRVQSALLASLDFER